MSQSPPGRPPPTSFFRGLANVADFLREGFLAVIEIVLGRWPLPDGERRRPPEAPEKGLPPIKKIAPYPIDD